MTYKIVSRRFRSAHVISTGHEETDCHALRSMHYFHDDLFVSFCFVVPVWYHKIFTITRNARSLPDFVRRLRADVGLVRCFRCLMIVACGHVSGGDHTAACAKVNLGSNISCLNDALPLYYTELQDRRLDSMTHGD